MDKVKKYNLNKFFLKFQNREIEESYMDLIIARTFFFNRITWGFAVFAVFIFSLIDTQEFLDNASMMFNIRLVVMAISISIIVISFNKKARKFYDKTAALFILIFGIFSSFLTVMNSTSLFSPYFFSFFFSFAGMFAIAGLGFRFNFLAMIINLVVLEITVFILFPVIPRLQILYSFFLPTAVIIFSYAGYIIEHISRKNFVTTMKLKDSIEEIKKLHRLLPICSNCKKIRDDKGYWNQIEEYFNEHSDFNFTHSICPECVNVLYPRIKKRN